MSCDSTYQRLAHQQAQSGKDKLEKHDGSCICDCALVEMTKGGEKPIAKTASQQSTNVIDIGRVRK